MSLTISNKDTFKPKVGDTLRLRFRGLRDMDGALLNLAGAYKVYMTIKDNLSDLDASAKVQINSVDNPEYFDLDYADQGDFDITYAPSDTEVAAEAIYYIDVRAVWADGAVLTLLYDTIVFEQPVTRNTA